jgi:hypothetical protein
MSISIAHPERYDEWRWRMPKVVPAGDPGEGNILHCPFENPEEWEHLGESDDEHLWGHLKPERRGDLVGDAIARVEEKIMEVLQNIDGNAAHVAAALMRGRG